MARECMRGSSSISSISSRSSQTHSRVLRWQLGSYQDSSPLRNRGRAVLKLLHDLGVHGLLILIQQRLMGKGTRGQVLVAMGGIDGDFHRAATAMDTRQKQHQEFSSSAGESL